MAVSFDNNLIFGRSISVITDDIPRTTQRTAFAGLNGMAILDLGQHGRTSEVNCVLFGPDAASLNAAIGAIRNYKDGNLYVFVDSYGNAWLNVMIESFRPAGRPIQDSRGFYQAYSITLFHAQ